MQLTTPTLIDKADRAAASAVACGAVSPRSGAAASSAAAAAVALPPPATSTPSVPLHAATCLNPAVPPSISGQPQLDSHAEVPGQQEDLRPRSSTPQTMPAAQSPSAQNPAAVATVSALTSESKPELFLEAGPRNAAVMDLATCVDDARGLPQHDQPSHWSSNLRTLISQLQVGMKA